MKTKINPWLKSLISLLQIGLLGLIIYLGGKFYAQIKDTENIKSMNNGIIDAILPLSNLLSRSSGSVNINEIHEHDHKIHIKPTLFYEQQKNSHKLELILANPSYSLIDCNAELASETVYPVKISFIWQPMSKFIDQYELVCERHNNFKNLNNSKNIQRKVLLQHINAVKLKFLESITETDEIREIKLVDSKELHKGHNQQISAVQIGMLVQSPNQLYTQDQHKNYHVFNKRINFLDRFLRKVIYITLPGNVT